MKSIEAQNRTRDILREGGIEDAAHEVNLLFRHVCGATRLEREDISEPEWEQLEALARRRAQREPLQYVLGVWPFLDLELALGPGVLIPRPETEGVCLTAAGLLKGKAGPAIADLCAGSGAIALALQSIAPGAKILALEKEEAAFGWLERNSKNFKKVTGNAPKLVQGDVLEFHKHLPDSSLDLIISNPPYVTEEEYAGLEPEIYYEPKSALVAADGGLAFYKAIAENYLPKLKTGGTIVFETGASQGPAVARILVEAGYMGTGLRKDLSGRQRIAIAMRGR